MLNAARTFSLRVSRTDEGILRPRGNAREMSKLLASWASWRRERDAHRNNDQRSAGDENSWGGEGFEADNDSNSSRMPKPAPTTCAEAVAFCFAYVTKMPLPMD